MKKKLRDFCPGCLEDVELELIESSEKVNVRGEIFEVNDRHFKCSVCGEEFVDLRTCIDPFDAAYRKYRSKHGMLQPEDILQFRKSYSLTQRELAILLGWGDVTLSRYENGALQDDAHEKLLRLVMEPRNLLKLIEYSPDALPVEKREMIVEKLTGSAGKYEDYFKQIIPKTELIANVTKNWQGGAPVNTKKGNVRRQFALAA